jgi:hypothetical protein
MVVSHLHPNPSLMKHTLRIVFAFLLASLATVGFSQQTNPRQEKKTQITEGTVEESKTNGLRKVTNNRNWNFEVNIDEEALEASIEAAIERAMLDVEVAMERLEKLEIHLEPIEINLSALENMDINIDPIVIDIGDLDIDIEVEVDELEDLDIEVDLGDLDEDEDGEADDDRKKGLKKLSSDPDKEKLKEKSDKEKEKGIKEDKKSKGLKKIE